MNKPIDLPVKHVSDTAWMVAVWRARESERPDARFHDEMAAKLVGEKGKEILAKVPYGEVGEWLMVVRTCVLDELILRLTQGNVDTVLNLAAGLDTRPYRLPLRKELRWIEADFPAVVEYKRKTLAAETPRCALKRVAVDLRDMEARHRLIEDANHGAAEALVLTEGLLGYLSPQNVAELATEFHLADMFQWWLMDITTPKFLAFARDLWGSSLDLDGVKLLFCPEEGAEYFRPFGWELTQFRSFEAESHSLKREPPVLTGTSFNLREAARDSGIALLKKGH